MSKELDNIIKEELTKGIDIFNEDEKIEKKPSKVYPKLAGLTNLGRTFFVSSTEIAEKNKQAQDKMLQKYGADIYGTLIKCSYSSFMTVPQKTIKESGGWDTFDNVIDDLIDYLDNLLEKNKDNGGLKSDVDELKKTIKQFDSTKGAREGNNKQIWNSMVEILNKATFKSDKGISELMKKLNSGYKAWKTGSNGKDYDPQTSSKGTDWNPNYSYRIDITTSFDDNWYKKKFKSGFLNKAIYAIRNDVYSRSFNDDVKNRKVSADDMEDSDRRKLDSIKWKMTNKVAKDYVQLLLGWSREKKINPDGSVTTELKEDASFGKKMASKALDNRGILGRLKQKLFAGGQDSGQISVAFQLGDKNDGSWKQLQNDDKSANDAQIEVQQDANQNESKDAVVERNKLVKEVCEGTTDVSKLIDAFLIG